MPNENFTEKSWIHGHYFIASTLSTT